MESDRAARDQRLLPIMLQVAMSKGRLGKVGADVVDQFSDARRLSETILTPKIGRFMRQLRNDERARIELLVMAAAILLELAKHPTISSREYVQDFTVDRYLWDIVKQAVDLSDYSPFFKLEWNQEQWENWGCQIHPSSPRSDGVFAHISTENRVACFGYKDLAYLIKLLPVAAALPMQKPISASRLLRESLHDMRHGADIEMQMLVYPIVTPNWKNGMRKLFPAPREWPLKPTTAFFPIAPPTYMVENHPLVMAILEYQAALYFFGDGSEVSHNALTAVAINEAYTALAKPDLGRFHEVMEILWGWKRDNFLGLGNSVTEEHLSSICRRYEFRNWSREMS
ncbi:hypothetical protein BDV95DRAFT_595358 [Massariosphaeria phaeospora]|uniref:Uncharacterized protein n=1 Tax=Massariosphaeria phaeospora TaxID=100035 RepID=A0A7C8MDJ1_9PLEO|nr:hypothetical protein BDV95DRAFT_595358 [Massariosphaeria phaeospora]